MNINTINILKSFFLIALFGTFSCSLVDNKKEPLKKAVVSKDTIPQENNRENSLKQRQIRIDSINKTLNWKKLDCGLYINKNDDIGFKFDFADEFGHSTSDYRTCLFSGAELKPLKAVIDTTTFRYLGSDFYKDKKNIYQYYDMAYGGRFSIYEGVDYASFRVIGDCYAKDKNHIYGERAGILEKVDYKTFRSPKGAGPYAKDKHGYYFWDELICTRKELRDSIKKPEIKELYDMLKRKHLIK